MHKPKSVFIKIQDQSYEYQILNVCKFNSTHKHMSTVIHGPDGHIKIYCKGVDTVILEQLSTNQPYSEATMVHLEVYLLPFPAAKYIHSYERIMPLKVFVLCVLQCMRFQSKNTECGLLSTIRPCLL